MTTKKSICAMPLPIKYCPKLKVRPSTQACHDRAGHTADAAQDDPEEDDEGYHAHERRYGENRRHGAAGKTGEAAADHHGCDVGSIAVDALQGRLLRVKGYGPHGPAYVRALQKKMEGRKDGQGENDEDDFLDREADASYFKDTGKHGGDAPGGGAESEQSRLADEHHQPDRGDDAVEKSPLHGLYPVEDEPIDQSAEKSRDYCRNTQGDEERDSEENHEGPRDVGPQHIELTVRDE